MRGELAVAVSHRWSSSPSIHFSERGGGGSFESDLIWKEAVEKKEEAIPFISADIKNISSWKYVLRNRQWENKYW